jgi:hypothetical protein
VSAGRADCDTVLYGDDLEPADPYKPEVREFFFASTLVDDGISGVGLAFFGMIVSLTGFRRGEKWAWYVSWSMPIGILVAQLNVYLLTGSVSVIVLGVVFVLVSLLALFLPFRQFFPKKMTHAP